MLRRTAICTAALVTLAAAAPAAHAASFCTAPGTSQAAGGSTVQCATANFTNALAVTNGDATLTLQPSFSGCTVAGVSASVTCGRWRLAVSPSLTLEFLQGPTPVPTGYSCRITAAMTCTIDVSNQTVSSGIALYNLNSSGVVTGAASAAGLRIAVGTSASLSYQMAGCGFLGIPNGSGTNGKYAGKAEEYGSGTTPRIWVVTP